MVCSGEGLGKKGRMGLMKLKEIGRHDSSQRQQDGLRWVLKRFSITMRSLHLRYLYVQDMPYRLSGILFTGACLTKLSILNDLTNCSDLISDVVKIDCRADCCPT